MLHAENSNITDVMPAQIPEYVKAVSLTSREILDVVVPSVGFTFVLDLADQTISLYGRIFEKKNVELTDISLQTYYAFLPLSVRDSVGKRYESFFANALRSDTTDMIEHEFTIDGISVLEIAVSMRSFSSEGRRTVFGIASMIPASGPAKGIIEQTTSDARTYFISYEVKKNKVVLSSALAKVLGYVTSNEQDFLFDQLLHSGDTESFVGELLGRIDQGTSIVDSVYRFLHRDGREILFKILRMTQEFNNNEMTRITVLLSDVSEMKNSELVRESIIDGAHCVSFVADLTKDEIRFSDNFLELLPGAELKDGARIMETIAAYVLDEDMSNVIEPMGEVLSGDKERYACEFRIRRNGENAWLALRGKMCRDRVSKNRLLVGTLTNLEDMRQYKRFAEDINSRHTVTQLPGRSSLLEATERVLCDRNVFSAAVILADLLSFQPLNDRFGREAGNHVLKSFALHLSSILPSGADLYHLAGDTFAILWPHASRIQIDRFMQYTIALGPLPVLLGKESIDIAFSLSGAVYPSCGSTAVELVENAEITLHKIKKSRRPDYALYSPKDKLEITEKLDFEFQISRSVRNTDDNFLLYFQPLVSPYDGKLLGAEALLRWISPTNEIISPERVIDGLTATGNLEYVSAWVLDKGIRQCKEWIDKHVCPQFLMHINITADDLMRLTFVEDVIFSLRKYGMHAENLMLEITESSLMKNISTCRKNILRLRSLGVKFSLDDFGSGYSSLNYLRELPVDEIKVDRAFLENVQKDSHNHSFVSAIVALAHSIQTKVCIEGVENKEQADAVRKLNPDLFQGFYFGKPVPPDAFEERYMDS